MNFDYDKVFNDFKNRGYELITTDIQNNKKKLEYKCLKHPSDSNRKISIYDFNRGRGCYECGRERTVKARIVPIDEIKKICQEMDFEYVDRVNINGRYFINFICNKHRERGIQSKDQGNLRNYHGCIYCSGVNTKEHDVFVNELKNVLPNIEVLSEYVTQKIKVKCKCLIHNEVFDSLPGNLLKGGIGCKQCAHFKRTVLKGSKEKLQQEVDKNNPHIKVKEYTGVSNKCKCYCEKHLKYFYTTPGNLKRGNSGCDECYVDNIRDNMALSQEEFLHNLSVIHPELSCNDTYINNSTYMYFYCSKHNYGYTSTYANVISKKGCCPRCSTYINESRIANILSKWDFKYEVQKTFQDCRDKSVLPFDFYLTDNNCAIEYDGEQHYRPVKYRAQSLESAIEHLQYTQHHDDIKTEYCQKHKIKLIRIPYWESDDLEYYLFDKLVKHKIIIET